MSIATYPALALAMLTGASAVSIDAKEPNGQRSSERRCISLDHVISRRGESDRVLEVTLPRGRTYRSILPAPCPHLAELDRFYTLRLENFAGKRVCAGDRFRVVDLRAAGPETFPLCRFGPFKELPSPR